MVFEAVLLYQSRSQSAHRIGAFSLKLFRIYTKRKTIPCCCDSILLGNVSLCSVKLRLLNGAQWQTERGGSQPAG